MVLGVTSCKTPRRHRDLSVQQERSLLELMGKAMNSWTASGASLSEGRA